MLNKLMAFSLRKGLLEKGDQIVCAVSGGADSMALLWALYLLKDQYDLHLSAAHFNHGLRGEESDRDEAFVREFCEGYGIPLYCQKTQVVAGKKGLEAAARDARYAFFHTLPGKIATAHTADDNAETVLMHIVRGTGLKGLGGISPVRGKFIRPMLSVTRMQVLAFLEQYHVPYVEDSSNGEDAYLRNRLRHHVMPLLRKENPKIAENMSAMALRLREDEEVLSQTVAMTDDVMSLRAMPGSVRARALTLFLQAQGVKEPDAEHIALLQSLVFSDNPSAKAYFPQGIIIGRNYDRLQKMTPSSGIYPVELTCPGKVELEDVTVICTPATEQVFQTDCFTVQPKGKLFIRSRQSADVMRLQGGSKKLKELFIDRKIPAAMRPQIPVIADDRGVVGVYGIGANLDAVSKSGVQIRFEKRKI